MEFDTSTTIRVNDSVKVFHLIKETLGSILPDALRPATTKPPVFISIDLEHTRDCITQLGVSTFDSQLLASNQFRRPISNDFPIPSTLYSTKTRKNQERRRKPLRFGEKHVLVPNELRSLIEGILTPKDEQGHVSDVVLVGHMIGSDVHEIKRFCGLDICRDVPSVKAVLDTQRIARPVLDTNLSLRLKHLLDMLGLEYIGLHNAAHDSRYTLRALLLLFCRAMEQSTAMEMMDRSHDMKQRFRFVEDVAKFHQLREPILWCENSPRVKSEVADMLDHEFDDGDANDRGLLARILHVDA